MVKMKNHKAVEKIKTMVATEEELKKLATNEERLWDMAAITAAPTLLGFFIDLSGTVPVQQSQIDKAAEEAYELADALLAERRRRFLK